MVGPKEDPLPKVSRAKKKPIGLKAWTVLDTGPFFRISQAHPHSLSLITASNTLLPLKCRIKHGNFKCCTLFTPSTEGVAHAYGILKYVVPTSRNTSFPRYTCTPTCCLARCSFTGERNQIHRNAFAGLVNVSPPPCPRLSTLFLPLLPSSRLPPAYIHSQSFLEHRSSFCLCHPAKGPCTLTVLIKIRMKPPYIW